MEIDEIKFNKIKDILQKNRYGRMVEGLLRQSGAVHFLHTVQMNRRRKKMKLLGGVNEFAIYYEINKRFFDEVFSLLEDDYSKKTFQAVINYRLTYEIREINPFVVIPQYFLKDILKPRIDYESFVDGGAYNGDSGKDFMEIFNESKRYMIYFWEADPRNIARLNDCYNKYPFCEIIPYAMWDCKSKLSFNSSGTPGAAVKSEGNVQVDANSIDRIHAGQEITFIKMDIEGAEIQALKGARKTIVEQKPKLAISIYHKFEHLYKIPLMIKEMVPDYKLYIRHHSDTLSDTVVYATIK